MQFTCFSCGATHEACSAADGPGEPLPDRAKLREKWLRAADTHTPTIDDEVGQAEVKASLVYFGTFRSGVPALPPTITTVSSAAGFRFQCVRCIVSR